MAFLRFGLIFCALFVFQCQANVLPSQPEAVGDEVVDGIKGIIDHVVKYVSVFLTNAEGMANYTANNMDRVIEVRDRVVGNLLDKAATLVSSMLDDIKPDVSPDAVHMLDCVEQQAESVKTVSLSYFDSFSTCVKIQSVAVFADVDAVLKGVLEAQSQIETIDTTLMTCNDLPCLFQQCIAIIDVLRGIPDKIHDDVAKLEDDGSAALEVAESCLKGNFPSLVDGIRLIFNNFASCARS